MLMQYMSLNFPLFHVCFGIFIENYCYDTSIHTSSGSMCRAPNGHETGIRVLMASPLR
jgi:hypothetical protein